MVLSGSKKMSGGCGLVFQKRRTAGARSQKRKQPGLDRLAGSAFTPKSFTNSEASPAPPSTLKWCPISETRHGLPLPKPPQVKPRQGSRHGRSSILKDHRHVRRALPIAGAAFQSLRSLPSLGAAQEQGTAPSQQWRTTRA